MTNYKRKKRTLKPPDKVYLINNKIPYPTVRMVDEEGEMIGIYPLKEGIEIAKEQEKDLILINPKAEPPIVKVIELSKFKYQNQKFESAAKSKASETKILLVSVRISDNDLIVRAKKAETILADGMKVKLQVKMRGREKAHPEVAEEMIKKFMTFIKHEYVVESLILLEGDSYTVVLKNKK